MKVTAEIAYYPLAKVDFVEIIKNVINEFPSFNLDLSYTAVSTIARGEHEELLALIKKIIEKYFPDNPSVLEVKFSNAC